MAVICVTGKMAAGKNTISSKFALRGWHVIDADETAHNAISKMTPVIIEEFASEAKRLGIKIENEGVIDRRALGRLLFRRPALLARQEAIVLPEVEREAMEEAQSAMQDGKDVVLNAVSLYKTPRLMSLCSLILFVTAPAYKRILRVRRRDGLSYSDIIKRFRLQNGLLDEYKKTRIPIALIRN